MLTRVTPRCVSHALPAQPHARTTISDDSVTTGDVDPARRRIRATADLILSRLRFYRDGRVSAGLLRDQVERNVDDHVLLPTDETPATYLDDDLASIEIETLCGVLGVP